MIFADLPPQMQELVVCSITAAMKYDIPANIMLAVAEKEGGKPGQWKKNNNGTSDVGPMQFNTAYLTELARYGITPDDVAAPGCYSFDLASWRLKNHIRNDQGDVWTRAANYHSRTYQYNTTYRTDLIKKADKWGKWLEGQLTAYDVKTPGQPPSMLSHKSEEKPVTTAMTVQQPIKMESNYVPRKITVSGQP